MKINTAKNDVTVNALESANYTISDEAKIFGMLMDGLYEDKITSITREIWTNAMDAHIDAGCVERPFEVSLPSMFTPVFTVRDYGVSLTHNQVMTLYTALGRSTKEGTNDTAGKWGIGSKAPFAYTDTFTVTAVKDGVRTFYTSTKDEKDKPVINVMGREDTDDEEGVEVSFPVHKEDINSFRTAAQRVSLGFDVKPIVTNEADFSGWEEIPVMLEGDGWKLLSAIPTGFNRGSYAKMGPVLYPITPSAVGDLTYEQRRILEYQFIFDFPMGELGISISRESLSYGRKDPTQAAITARLSIAMDELEEMFIAKYAEMPTLWEATKALNDDLSSGHIPIPVSNGVQKKARWHGEVLSTSIKGHMRGSMVACHIEGKKLRHKTVRFKRNEKHYNGTRDVTISPKNNPLVVIEDETMVKPAKRVGERIKLFTAASSHGSILWIKFRAGKKSSVALIEFLTRIEGATVVLAHELDAPERAVRERGEYTPVQARKFNGSNFDQLELAWRWRSADYRIDEDLLYFTGDYRATPLVVDGVMYTATNHSQVVALDPATGEELWIFDPQSYALGPPNFLPVQTRGIEYWTDGEVQRIFIATLGKQLVSIDIETGLPDPNFGENGFVDLRSDLGRLEFEMRNITHGAPPIAVGNTVIIGSKIYDYIMSNRSPPGHVRAYDARGGRVLSRR